MLSPKSQDERRAGEHGALARPHFGRPAAPLCVGKLFNLCETKFCVNGTSVRRLQMQYN